MLFGINKLKLTILLMLIVSLTACAQSDEARLKQSQQHQEKSNELRLQGNLEAAITEQLKAIEITPNDLQAQSVLGSLYNQTAREKNKPEYFRKAQESLEKAIKLDPNDAVSHSMLAKVLDQTGNKQGALREWREAARLEPTRLYYLTNIGVGEHLLNDNQSAKVTFQTILQKYPKHIYTLYRYAEVEAEDRNFDKAIDLFEKAINSEPSEAEDEDFQQTARKRLAEIREKLKPKTLN